MDTQEAAQQYTLALNSWEGKDGGGGPILNMAGGGYSVSYLGYKNIPDTGYGDV
jgi:hypothetical protein